MRSLPRSAQLFVGGTIGAGRCRPRDAPADDPSPPAAVHRPVAGLGHRLGPEAAAAARHKCVEPLCLLHHRLCFADPARPEPHDAGGGPERVGADDRPDRETQPGVPDLFQHRGADPDRAGAPDGCSSPSVVGSASSMRGSSSRSSEPRSPTTWSTPPPSPAPSDCPPASSTWKVWHEQLPLDGAELFRRRRRRGGRRLGLEHGLGLADAARRRARLPDVPFVPRLPRTNRRRAAASRGDGQAPLADRRSAHGRQAVGTAVRARRGRLERRTVGLGPRARMRSTPPIAGS